MTQPVRRPSMTPFAPGFADEAVLRLVATYHYLTAQQICRARYAPGSLTRVQTIVKRLRDAGYLQAIFLPRRTQAGSAPSVYTLTRKGRLYLQQQGVPVTIRVRPSEEQAHSYLFLAHTLCVNDVLLAAVQVTQQEQGIQLVRMHSDHELKHTPLSVTTRTGEHLGVIPDAWLDFRVGLWQHCIAVELDRGTEEKKAWIRKVQGLGAAATGPFQVAFDTDSLTIAVLTTVGQKRVSDLMRWTAEELAVGGQMHLAGYFCFSSLLPATTPPRQLFLERTWQVIGTDTHQALISSDE